MSQSLIIPGASGNSVVILDSVAGINMMSGPIKFDWLGFLGDYPSLGIKVITVTE
jgi:hypothetical protein